MLDSLDLNIVQESPAWHARPDVAAAYVTIGKGTVHPTHVLRNQYIGTSAVVLLWLHHAIMRLLVAHGILSHLKVAR